MARRSSRPPILPAPIELAHGLDIRAARDSYQRHLRAANRSPATIKTYLAALAQFIAFLERQGMPTGLPAIRREHVEAFIVDLQSGGRRPATVSLAYRSLQPFFRWAVSEDEIADSPMSRMTAPIVPEAPPPILRDDEIAALLKACEGSDFEARRDTAIVRLLLDTGMRRGELTALKTSDIDFDHDVAVVMGKGRRPRACPFGSKTARALDRYLRMRARHPQAASEQLWLGLKGGLTDNGILQMLRRRGTAAGLVGLHPHQFRHTFAHAWLAAGGAEGDLMRLAGWRSRQMLSRYVVAGRRGSGRRGRPGSRRGSRCGSSR